MICEDPRFALLWQSDHTSAFLCSRTLHIISINQNLACNNYAELSLGMSLFETFAVLVPDRDKIMNCLQTGQVYECDRFFYKSEELSIVFFPYADQKEDGSEKFLCLLLGQKNIPHLQPCSVEENESIIDHLTQRETVSSILQALTPLTKLLYENDLLDDDIYVESIRHNCSTLMRNSMLLHTYYRVVNNPDSLQRRTLCLNSFLTHLVTSVSSRVHITRHTLVSQICDTYAVASIDPDTLNTALNCILSNCCTFSEKQQPGNPNLLPSTFSLKMSCHAKEAIITISDNGFGMDSSMIRNALTPFYTNGISDGSSHLGIGLPLAQKIILAHGGSLMLSSQPGQGTSVAIRLPLLSNDAPVSGVEADLDFSNSFSIANLIFPYVPSSLL